MPPIYAKKHSSLQLIGPAPMSFYVVCLMQEQNRGLRPVIPAFGVFTPLTDRAHTAVYGKAKYDVVDVSGVGVPKSVISIDPCIDKNVLAANKTGLDKPRNADSTAATIDEQVQPIEPLIKELNIASR